MNVWAFTSLPMVATSVAGMSAPTSRPNSTSADQDTSPFNRPLSKAEGTSMPGIYTSGLPINVMDTAQDNSINETPTYLDSSSSIPSSGSVKAPVGSRPLLLESPLRSGSPTLANPFLIQPSKPVGNYYSPPPPPPTSIPESGMKVKDPPTSTASLDPGGAYASKTRKRRKRPHKKNQHSLPQFHGVGQPSTYVCFISIYILSIEIIIDILHSFEEADLDCQDKSIRRCLEVVPAPFPSFLLTLDLVQECMVDQRTVMWSNHLIMCLNWNSDLITQLQLEHLTMTSSSRWVVLVQVPVQAWRTIYLTLRLIN